MVGASERKISVKEACEALSGKAWKQRRRVDIWSGVMNEVGGGEDKSDQGNHRAEQGPETLHRCMGPRAEHRTPLSYENERFCRFTFNVDHISLPN